MSIINYPRSVDSTLLAILVKIMEKESFNQFALGGGTSLALRFGHRSSADIDLFSSTDFDSLQLQASLAVDFPEFQVINRTQGSLCIYFRKIKIDFLSHPYPLLEDINREDLYRFLSIKDLSAMKINAVTNRGSKKDFTDLLELHLQGVPLPEALNNFIKKYNGNRLLAVRSLLWFADAENEPDPVFLNSWSWDFVRSEMQKLADNLLSL